MPDDLRWSWCINNRNKVHNICNALESPQNHLPTLVHEKIVFLEAGPWCQKGWGPLLYYFPVSLRMKSGLRWSTESCMCGPACLLTHTLTYTVHRVPVIVAFLFQEHANFIPISAPIILYLPLGVFSSKIVP